MGGKWSVAQLPRCAHAHPFIGHRQGYQWIVEVWPPSRTKRIFLGSRLGGTVGLDRVTLRAWREGK